MNRFKNFIEIISQFSSVFLLNLVEKFKLILYKIKNRILFLSNSNPSRIDNDNPNEILMTRFQLNLSRRFKARLRTNIRASRWHRPRGVTSLRSVRCCITWATSGLTGCPKASTRRATQRLKSSWSRLLFTACAGRQNRSLLRRKA